MPQQREQPVSSLAQASLLLILIVFMTLAQADSVPTPRVNDFRRTAEIARETAAPILLLVSQYHCEYCGLMKREIIHPMLLSGEYEGRVIIREILIDPGEMVINFRGIREPADDFAHGYGVYVTPTLLFLDANGNEVAERIIGINTIEFLPFYIDDAIDSARQKGP